jgi:hypothetical protein
MGVIDDQEMLRKGLAISGEVIRRVGLLILTTSTLDEPLELGHILRCTRAMEVLEKHGKEVRQLLAMIEAEQSNVH